MLDLEPLWLTAKLSFITTIILFFIALPLSWWLASGRSKWKAVVEALVSMPLVLPPSVLGFYLLLAFSPQNAFGNFLDRYFDVRLVFTFEGLVLASVVYSLPFMVHPLQAGLKNLPATIREASYTLGKSRLTTLFRVALPNMKPALLTGLILTFAHTVGEFGVVLMVGGSIPRETKVVSISVYDAVQAMNYESANLYSGVLFLFAFLVLIGVYVINSSFRSAALFND